MTWTSRAEIAGEKTGHISWWLVLLEGLAALIVGIYLLISPITTAVILVAILGWYWLVSGILTLVSLFRDKRDGIWGAVGGILGVLAGIAIIENPIWSAAVVPEMIVIVAGVLGVCFGFISLFWALKEGWGAAIMGALSVIFGLLLLGSPMIGIAMLAYLLGALGIAGGAASIYMAMRMRSA